MDRLRRKVLQFRNEIATYRLVMKDPRTPRRVRWLLGVAIAYAVSPIDLIPDFIPILGHMDDVLVLSLLVWLALRAMPPDLLAEHRSKATREGTTRQLF